MTDTYLTTAYKDREQVKALGARWDPVRKQWYVGEGRDLAPFATWLPAGLPAQASGFQMTTPATALTATSPSVGTGLAVAQNGIGLSQLLAGVAQAVAQACKAGIWTRVEVVKADLQKGTVRLELAERDSGGNLLAQARSVIWADTANQIVPAFERATGVVLGAASSF